MPLDVKVKLSQSVDFGMVSENDAAMYLGAVSDLLKMDDVERVDLRYSTTQDLRSTLDPRPILVVHLRSSASMPYEAFIANVARVAAKHGFCFFSSNRIMKEA